MDLKQEYKKESGFSVGTIHDIGSTYYSNDYVDWLESKIDFIASSLLLTTEEKIVSEVKKNYEKKIDKVIDTFVSGDGSLPPVQGIINMIKVKDK